MLDDLFGNLPNRTLRSLDLSFSAWGVTKYAVPYNLTNDDATYRRPFQVRSENCSVGLLLCSVFWPRRTILFYVLNNLTLPEPDEAEVFEFGVLEDVRGVA